MTPDGHCETMGELMDYIETNAEHIHVRARNPVGELVTMPLAVANVPTALEYVFRWLRAGQTPVMVKPEAEGAES